jgi:hypothetical protein
MVSTRILQDQAFDSRTHHHHGRTTSGRNREFQETTGSLGTFGETAGLTAPITFEGLTLLEQINGNEVVTTLPEVVRFIMWLDERGDAAGEERHEDTRRAAWSSEADYQGYYSKPANREKCPERS